MVLGERAVEKGGLVNLQRPGEGWNARERYLGQTRLHHREHVRRGKPLDLGWAVGSAEYL